MTVEDEEGQKKWFGKIKNVIGRRWVEKGVDIFSVPEIANSCLKLGREEEEEESLSKAGGGGIENRTWVF
jgi:hypothetical protein